MSGTQWKPQMCMRMRLLACTLALNLPLLGFFKDWFVLLGRDESLSLERALQRLRGLSCLGLCLLPKLLDVVVNLRSSHRHDWNIRASRSELQETWNRETG